MTDSDLHDAATNALHFARLAFPTLDDKTLTERTKAQAQLLFNILWAMGFRPTNDN